MDTMQQNSASRPTMTEFLQSDERGFNPQNEGERPKQRPSHTPPPVHQEKFQLYPQPISPLGYYPYIPPLLPSTPTMSYLYMDFLRRLSLESELHSYLPKFESLFNENNSKVCDGKTNNVRLNHNHTVENNDCNLFHCKDRAYSTYSHLCLSCKQSPQCSCCSKPLSTERVYSSVNKPSCNYCHHLISPHSHMHIQPCPVLSYDCVCEKKKIITKLKSKQKSKNKSNQTSLQTDRNNIPERDKTRSQVSNQKKIEKKGYRKYESCESSSSDESFSQTGNRTEVYESEDDKMFGVYTGEGDKHKTNKSEVKKKEKRKRQSLSYFINV